MPKRNVTMITATGGDGKSLLCQQLASCTVLGRDWLGVRVRRGPVLYLNAEDDDDELHRRQQDIARHMDVPMDRFAELYLWPLAGGDAVIASAEDRGNVVRPTALWRKLEREVAKLKPALVILDPLANLFAGNEIIRCQAQQFVGLLRGMAIRSDTTVLFAAHPSLTGMAQRTGSSGSTAWANSVRSRLYLERPEKGDEDARVLTNNKTNYGKFGSELRFRWANGVFVLDSSAAAAAERAERDAKDDELFLTLLGILESQNAKASNLVGRNYAPKVMADMPAAKGVTHNRLELAMKRLLEAGRIRSITVGPRSNSSVKLEIVL
jgi:RecA-family ATPase